MPIGMTPVMTEEEYERDKAARKAQIKRPPKLASASFWAEKERKEKRQSLLQQRAEARKQRAAEREEKAAYARGAREMTTIAKKEEAAAKKEEAEEIREGAILARTVLKKEKERKELLTEKAPRVAAGITGRVMGGLKGLVTSAVPQVKRIRIPRGIRHPDTLIAEETKSLYLPVAASRLQPLSEGFHQAYSKDRMVLYFPGRSRTINDANLVYNYLLQGRDYNELEVLTGLPPARINAAMNYLIRQKAIGVESP